jgi:hypothetical protein
MCLSVFFVGLVIGANLGFAAFAIISVGRRQ